MLTGVVVTTNVEVLRGMIILLVRIGDAFAGVTLVELCFRRWSVVIIGRDWLSPRFRIRSV